jgi:hypothetical protein
MKTVLAHGFQLRFAVYMYIIFSSPCSSNLTVVVVNTGIIFNTIKNILHSYITFIPETPGIVIYWSYQISGLAGAELQDSTSANPLNSRQKNWLYSGLIKEA